MKCVFVPNFRHELAGGKQGGIESVIGPNQILDAQAQDRGVVVCIFRVSEAEQGLQGQVPAQGIGETGE